LVATVISLLTGAAPETADPNGLTTNWSPDSQSLVFIDLESRVSNLWA
jgi:hypothetical protein